MISKGGGNPSLFQAPVRRGFFVGVAPWSALEEEN
jgi:hypothetical protein